MDAHTPSGVVRFGLAGWRSNFHTDTAPGRSTQSPPLDAMRLWGHCRRLALTFSTTCTRADTRRHTAPPIECRPLARARDRMANNILPWWRPARSRRVLLCVMSLDKHILWHNEFFFVVVCVCAFSALAPLPAISSERLCVCPLRSSSPPVGVTCGAHVCDGRCVYKLSNKRV